MSPDDYDDEDDVVIELSPSSLHLLARLCARLDQEPGAVMERAIRDLARHIGVWP